MNHPSETVTENIFRDFYGSKAFIEKSSIPKEYGFLSKKRTGNAGYPDFFLDLNEFVIIVEAKANSHQEAEEEVVFYAENNGIDKDVVCIAISGQSAADLKITYYIKERNSSPVEVSFNYNNELLTISNLEQAYRKEKYGEAASVESLIAILKELNSRFHKDNKVRATDRSLFFSGLMIALSDRNFKSTFNGIQPPSIDEASTVSVTVLESHNLNNSIVNAISKRLDSKINNLSKEFNWKDRFSFIRSIDYPLYEYIHIIKEIESKIFDPFKNDEKQDILGRAYKVFLSRAGKAEDKNIILTPDHIKELMVKLARLTVDDVVLDTCTGSGGFLMESMETMVRLAKSNKPKINNIKENQLIGFENDSVLFALACSNMFLHGDGRTNLLYRSSLLDASDEGVINNGDSDLFEYIKRLRPTKVIINPPYEKNSSIKFTKQAIDYLESNGKLIVIMPNPTLTQNYQNLTHRILSMAKLEFVIKMPKNLFSEQKRTVNTSIFCFTKTPHMADDDVLFYDLKDDGFVSVQHKGKIDVANGWGRLQDGILSLIRNGKNEQGLCTKRKIYQDGKLNCAGFKGEDERNSGFKAVQIKDLFNIESGSLASGKCSENGRYPFITAAEDWKVHDSFSHDEEAIVYATKSSGSLGRSHYVNGKFTASNLCLILTIREEMAHKVNLEFYSEYFSAIKDAIVSDLADGTSKLTISEFLFGEYYIDYIPIKIQNNICQNHLKKILNLKKEVYEEELKVKKEIDGLLIA